MALVWQLYHTCHHVVDHFKEESVNVDPYKCRHVCLKLAKRIVTPHNVVSLVCPRHERV